MLIKNPSVPYDEIVKELEIFRRRASIVFDSLIQEEYIKRVDTNKCYWEIVK